MCVENLNADGECRELWGGGKGSEFGIEKKGRRGEEGGMEGSEYFETVGVQARFAASGGLCGWGARGACSGFKGFVEFYYGEWVWWIRRDWDGWGIDYYMGGQLYGTFGEVGRKIESKNRKERKRREEKKGKKAEEKKKEEEIKKRKERKKVKGLGVFVGGEEGKENWERKGMKKERNRKERKKEREEFDVYGRANMYCGMIVEGGGGKFLGGDMYCEVSGCGHGGGEDLSEITMLTGDERKRRGKKKRKVHRRVEGIEEKRRKVKGRGISREEVICEIRGKRNGEKKEGRKVERKEKWKMTEEEREGRKDVMVMKERGILVFGVCVMESVVVLEMRIGVEVMKVFLVVGVEGGLGVEKSVYRRVESERGGKEGKNEGGGKGEEKVTRNKGGIMERGSEDSDMMNQGGRTWKGNWDEGVKGKLELYWHPTKKDTPYARTTRTCAPPLRGGGNLEEREDSGRGRGEETRILSCAERDCEVARDLELVGKTKCSDQKKMEGMRWGRSGDGREGVE
ncbi:hypothetical protein Tco_0791480 [Tanacetum coccineum]